MIMPNLVRLIPAILAAGAAIMAAITPLAYGAEAAPVGSWRSTNACFLAIFVLADGGKAQALYLSGERDDNAAWTWDGSTLSITSAEFPMDSFSGHLADSRVEADYVWHDLESDMLNKQACVFERFTTLGR